MRLGISSYTYTWAVGVPGHPPEHPLEAVDLIERAAGLGVHLVQIADNLPLERLSPTQLAAVERAAAGLGVAVEVGTRGIDPDHLHACLRLTERLGSPLLRIVVDTADHRPSEEEVVATLGSLAGAVGRAWGVLANENHDRFPVASLARILERIGSESVGICLDTVNSFGAQEGPAVVVDALAPWTVNLHVKDYAIRRVDHQMGFVIEGRPAGEGQLDVPRLLDRLRDAGRDPNAILELWTPPAETPAETIAREEAWAAASVQYLRRFIPE